MDRGVHLRAPGDRRRVGRREVGERRARDQEVGLGVPDEVLDDALRFRVCGLAEVGPEAVVGSEGEVAWRRHDDVGDDTALEAAHPVGEHDRGHTAQEFEALGEQGEGRRLGLVEGEPDEAPAAPGQDRAEHVEAALAAPVDREVLARHRLPGAVHAAVAPPVGLGCGDRPAQVTGRARVPGGPASGQEALGADPAVGRPDALGDQDAKRIGRLRTGRPFHRRLALALHDVAHRPVGRPAQGRRGPIGAELAIRGQDVQLVPR